MRGYSLATFVFCAVTSLLSFQASDARADPFSRSMSPLYCSVANRDQQWGPASPYDYAITNLSATTDMAIACGVPNDSNLRHHDSDAGYVSLVYVVGNTNSSGITNACACVSYSAATGGSCGTQTSITVTPYAGQLDVASGSGSWLYTSSHDMPYIYMVLKPCTPSASCTAYNTLRGYRVVHQ
jgi:hypothetical protein